MGKTVSKSRDRLGLMLGLILLVIAVALIVVVVLVRGREGAVEIAKGMSVNWRRQSPDCGSSAAAA